MRRDVLFLAHGLSLVKSLLARHSRGGSHEPASVVGRVPLHGDVNHDQEEKNDVAMPPAVRGSSREHSVVHAVEHAGEYIESDESDPDEDHEHGQDHDEERGHEPFLHDTAADGFARLYRFC